MPGRVIGFETSIALWDLWAAFRLELVLLAMVALTRAVLLGRVPLNELMEVATRQDGLV